MNQRTFLSTCLLALLPIWGWGQDVSTCRAELRNDTLRLENQQFARVFRWNRGHLISLSLTDKKRNRTWAWATREPDCAFPGHATPEGEGILSTRPVVGQPNETDHLEVSVTAQLGTLHVRRVFRLHPNLPTLTVTFYLRGTPSVAWREAAGAANRPEFKNIESQKDLNSLAATVPVMDRLSLPGNHWKLRPVEFFDVTDRANTLVRETGYNLYRQPGFLAGNLLLLKDQDSDYSFFVLKEAPSSAVQLANPGFDFIAKIGSIQTAGVGLLPSDLSETTWLRGYGYTLGLGGMSTLETLQTLRRYQDAKRPRRPDRDEMLLMNTWGDRSQDKKVGEKFTIAELQQAARLGITHLQLDDGWQGGRSGNSAFKGGSFKSIHRNPDYWKPSPERFPNGLKPVLDEAKRLGIQIGLWFNPSVDSSFQDWKKDAQTLIGLHRDYGVNTFKIDGVQIDDKAGEVNFRHLIDSVLQATNYRVVFNMDVTAGRRNGYHYFNEYGNLFLENRYTDWGNYYPYWTLRNLWNLARYVPPQNLQIEFLNKWRNADKYPAGDAFAPATYSFDYLFAITMMAQPLAWFEGTGLPAEALSTGKLIRTYRAHREDVHAGQIFPIGDEPSGRSWTGFQSIRSAKTGYVLVFREKTTLAEGLVKTWLPAGKRVRFEPVAGSGKAFAAVTSAEGTQRFALPNPNAFALYRYTVE